MLILFDNNVPRGVARVPGAHSVVEARAKGWHMLKNGDLLNTAESASFDVMITSDKSISYQQNLSGRRIALVALTKGGWRLVRQRLDAIASAVGATVPCGYVEVEIPLEQRWGD